MNPKHNHINDTTKKPDNTNQPETHHPHPNDDPPTTPDHYINLYLNIIHDPTNPDNNPLDD